MKLRMATPGPTEVPHELLLAGAQQLIHHRSPQMEAMIEEINAGLSRVFRTEQAVYTMLSSGTGAMEAAVANCLNVGDKAIVVVNGYFGERFQEIAEAYGVEVIAVSRIGIY